MSVSTVMAINFDYLDLERSFSGTRYIFGISRSSSYIKVITSRSRSKQQTRCLLCILFEGGLPSTEKQSF